MFNLLINAFYVVMVRIHNKHILMSRNEISQCSDFWQWHVTSPPKILKKLGADKVCEEKETVTFKVEAEADPAPNVTWLVYYT